MRVLAVMVVFITLLLTGTPAVAELDDVPGYRKYSKLFSSAGQPSEEQLQDAWAAGFDRVIYLAFTDHDTSLEHEDRIVKTLGMEYLQIPIAWSEPTLSDFDVFTGAMQRAPDKKTLLHCQANFRASSFSFLYRVIYLGVPIEKAKADLNSVWTPNLVWTNFILKVLDENDISSDCGTCDWTPQEQ